MKKILPYTIICACLSLSACTSTSKIIRTQAQLKPFKEQVQITQIWDTNTNNSLGNFRWPLNPALNNDHLISASSNGRVTIINAKSGDEIFTNRYKQVFSSNVASTQNTIYLGTQKGKVLAINSTTGQILWNASASSTIIAAPIADQTTVYVKAIDNSITAYQSINGNTKWTYSTDVPELQLQAASNPILTKYGVLVGFNNGIITMLNKTSGAVIWQNTITTASGINPATRMADIDANPIIDDNNVYAASYQGNIAAISLRNGHTIWQQPLSTYTGLAASSDTIVATDDKSEIWAFNKNNGKVLWHSLLLQYRNITAPLIIKQHVIIADASGYCHILSLSDGHLEGRSKLDRTGFSKIPLMYNNNIILVANNGRAYSVGINT